MTARDEAALDLSNLQHSLGFQLAIAAVTTRRAFHAQIGEPFQLRPVEFTLLMVLLGNPVVSPKQLARTLSLPPPNVSVLLDRLTARELVERRRSTSDGRAVDVALTPPGAALAQQVHRISLTMEGAVLARLSPGEQAMLGELLRKLAPDGEPD